MNRDSQESAGRGRVETRGGGGGGVATVTEEETVRCNQTSHAETLRVRFHGGRKLA